MPTVTATPTDPSWTSARVTLSGEVDLAALERLRTVMACVSSCREVIVETDEVGFIDCCALAPMLACARTVTARGGVLCLADPSPAVTALITWCRLEARLPTCALQRDIR